MKVYTHLFSSKEALELFLHENHISDSIHLLIQCFDGTLDVEKTSEILINLKALLPSAYLIGSSTDGEIIDGDTKNNSLIFNFSLFDSTSIVTYIKKLEDDSFVRGVEIGTLSLLHNAKAAILFADGLNCNGDDLIKGISSTHSDSLFAGGMSGDNALFKQTYVILDDTIYFNSIVIAFLSGDTLRANSNYSFNWIPIGPIFTVTHAVDNRIYTIDDIPIVQVYREYLGDAVANSLPAVGVAFPLIMRSSGDLIGRSAIGIYDDGSLLFGGNIPKGEKVQLGLGNGSLMLENADATVRQINTYQPQGIYIYSCMARRRFLGDSIRSEIFPLQQIAPVSGFFTYGEFYTNQLQKQCSLMNQTMSILTLSEDPLHTQSLKNPFQKVTHNDWSIITFHALSHLINKTSIELEMLNSTLKRRISQEITQNREKDKMMLSQAKRATMGEMIGMIAHQWRQPIATIGLISDNLALDVALDEVTTEKISSSTTMINDQVQHLSKTIDDFSNYFRPENNQESFRIEEFYNEIVAIIGKSLEHRGIAISFDFQSDSFITTHKRELMQICLNLINNSKDAIVDQEIKHGYIHFLHRFINDKDQIHISDNGGGIPDDIMDRIFDPYFSTKTDKNGTGLGLYMSKTIAQKHLNGDLIAINNPDGAVFIITISEFQKADDE
jgi:signal transduction histidine kinase